MPPPALVNKPKVVKADENSSSQDATNSGTFTSLALKISVAALCVSCSTFVVKAGRIAKQKVAGYTSKLGGSRKKVNVVGRQHIQHEMDRDDFVAAPPIIVSEDSLLSRSGSIANGLRVISRRPDSGAMREFNSNLRELAKVEIADVDELVNLVSHSPVPTDPS